jgi:hypothetical protein
MKTYTQTIVDICNAKAIGDCLDNPGSALAQMGETIVVLISYIFETNEDIVKHDLSLMRKKTADLTLVKNSS